MAHRATNSPPPERYAQGTNSLGPCLNHECPALQGSMPQEVDPPRRITVTMALLPRDGRLMIQNESNRIGSDRTAFCA